jgi:hypothetical protein
MANRVWKRSAEYSLILAERRRIRAKATPAETAGLGDLGHRKA